jgi:hypothetical protein
MVIKTILILVVIAVLMEDGSSIKKSEEEKREDKELAELVNKTLAEEKRKEDEEKRQEDEKKKKNQTRTEGNEKDKKKEDVDETGKDQDEACPPLNSTCPTEDPCPEIQECPPCKECGSCPPVKCKPCPRCEDPKECPPVECPPVLPCPADNDTQRGQELPTPPSCPELPSMTVPVALATGAIVSLLTVSAAAALGLVLRYVPPLISGFLFLVLILMVWFLSSRYPEVARVMGARAWTIMQEATSALSHRIVDALRHHNEQVGVLILSLVFNVEFHVSFTFLH